VHKTHETLKIDPFCAQRLLPHDSDEAGYFWHGPVKPTVSPAKAEAPSVVT
jgi:hypothetical protein